jgi:hypothetical protein
VANEVDRQRAIVESASALTPATQAELQASLSKKYGRTLNLVFHTNPELLGGIRVKVGSDVWDGSVKARLEALKPPFPKFFALRPQPLAFSNPQYHEQHPPGDRIPNRRPQDRRHEVQCGHRP